jgi:hypothetical protein
MSAHMNKRKGAAEQRGAKMKKKRLEPMRRCHVPCCSAGRSSAARGRSRRLRSRLRRGRVHGGRVAWVGGDADLPLEAEPGRLLVLCRLPLCATAPRTAAPSASSPSLCGGGSFGRGWGWKMRLVAMPRRAGDGLHSLD